MDILQQLHDALAEVASHLKASGEQIYTETAAKVQAKVEAIKPLLADDVTDVEQRARELFHELFS